MNKYTTSLLFTGLFVAAFGTAFSQYDSPSWSPYTGGYSGSSGFDIDYTTSPTWTTVPKTGSAGSSSKKSGSGSGSGSETSSGTKSSEASLSKCPGTSILDLKSPADTFQVKMDDSGAVYYIGTTEKIDFLKVDDATKKISYEKSGQPSVEVGQITVCGKEYPEYGYIFREQYNSARGIKKESTTSSPTPSTNAAAAAPDLTVPEDSTAVTVNADTGEVFNGCTKTLMTDAFYNKIKHGIFASSASEARYGTMLTETKGYIFLDTRKGSSTCYVWDSPIPESSPFSDIPSDHPAAKAINFAIKEGWINQSKKFYPSRAIKGCELAKIMVNMARVELKKDFTAEFVDVPQSSPYAAYVATGFSKGWFSPLPGSKNTFGCKKNVTRGRFAEILVNAFELKEKNDYVPGDSVGTWSLESIQKVVTAGFMDKLEGTENFGAKKSISRADFIVSLARAFGVK